MSIHGSGLKSGLVLCKVKSQFKTKEAGQEQKGNEERSRNKNEDRGWGERGGVGYVGKMQQWQLVAFVAVACLHTWVFVCLIAAALVIFLYIFISSICIQHLYFS